MYAIYVRPTGGDMEIVVDREETPFQLHGTLSMKRVYLLYGTASPSILPEYKDYEHIFTEEEVRKLPPHGLYDHTIETKGKEPPYDPLYSLSADEFKVLGEHIEEQLAKGFLRPNNSPAETLVLFVSKKGGGLQLCVDYRGLNSLTKKNRYLLPLICEVLDRLVGVKKYIKLDILDTYNMICICKVDEWKTAFRTRYENFEYTVMPFGLINASVTFQSYINSTLRDYLDVFYIAYLDNILIYLDNDEDHTKHVRKVLTRLEQHRLYVKLSKCKFHTRKVGFLGFVVTSKGVFIEEDRVRTIREWPELKKY